DPVDRVFSKSFKVISLFSYQGSLLLLLNATRIVYHPILHMSTIFSKKISKNKICFSWKNGERGI
ncbi:MAG: hypothetical protein K2N01_08540, partial [Lachnospiraceae bacterium]|nr:hypothetical protein [Lachnospiraceae bacterium]